jgi:hypothetical protein
MHPVTRLGRVIQQLRSFGDLHASELETMAATLDQAGAAELAQQLRAYRDVQRDEATMVVDELTDIQNDMMATAQPSAPLELPSAAAPGAAQDPAANSPRRAQWLAEQAAEEERLKQPLSRRDLFEKVAQKDDDD